MKYIFGLLVLVCVVSATVSPNEWIKQGAADPEAKVTFRVALKQQNVASFEEHVLEISNPKSPLYTNYMSIDEVLDWIAPPQEVPAGIMTWMSLKCPQEDEISIVDQRDSLKVEATVQCVYNLFRLPLYSYTHKTYTMVKIIRMGDVLPTIPDEIMADIDFLSGLNVLPPVRRSLFGAGTPGQYSYNYIIPDTVRRMYNIPMGTKATNAQNTQAAIEFLPVGAPSISDLQAFDTDAGELFTNITTIVGPWEQGSDGESTLDIQYLTTVGAGGVTWYITIPDGWAYDMANTLFQMSSPPLVNSVSYGWPEELTCQSVTNANCTGMTTQQYVVRANAELAKVAARGISVLIASQDEGAPSEANDDCSLDTTHPLWPIYPSASPWVTAVSATTLIDTDDRSKNVSPYTLPPICNMGYTCDTTGTLQMPCMENNTEYQWTTGGGFSKYAALPSYQKNAVSQYLASQSIIPPTQWFNPANRGYPDVAAVGDRILIIIGGGISVTAGTSAATPIFSGIVTLLNDWRLNHGKKPLGFLNPMLYQMAAEAPSAFNLVTMGNNKCTLGACCTYGYGANYQGWDPVTGLGTPNYQEMLAYIQTLP